MLVVEASTLAKALSLGCAVHERFSFKTVETQFGNLPLRVSYRDTTKFGWWQDLVLLKHCAAFAEELSDAIECFEQQPQNRNVAEFRPKIDSILEELFLRMIRLGFVTLKENDDFESLGFCFIYNQEKRLETAHFLSSIVSKFSFFNDNQYLRSQVRDLMWKLKLFDDDHSLYVEAMAIGFSLDTCRWYFRDVKLKNLKSARRSFLRDSSRVYALDFGGEHATENFLRRGYVTRDPEGNFRSTLYGCLTLGFFIDAYHQEKLSG